MEDLGGIFQEPVVVITCHHDVVALLVGVIDIFKQLGKLCLLDFDIWREGGHVDVHHDELLSVCHRGFCCCERAIQVDNFIEVRVHR